MNKENTITEILGKLGIEELNDMQVKAQSTILKEPNTVLISPTGSGKTLAFLLPVLELLKKDIPGVQCMIIVPSRELGLQIERVWKKMGTDFKINICYGGHSMETEIKNLSNPPAVLIGTPGRLADHIERGTFEWAGVQVLVLDEFDKSLELGFHEEMDYIIGHLDNLKKRILVSATSAIRIPGYTGVVKPVTLDFRQEENDDSQLSIKLVRSEEKDKVETLFNLICTLDSEAAIVFCNHREAVERVCDYLNHKGIYATFYHGGMDQEERERALLQFRNGSISYLITTDLAARGLDIPEMNHVIHYHLPLKEEEFTHRNGRTARMLATGTAYILHHETDKKTTYIDYGTRVLEIEKCKKLPAAPQFQTLYISGGKKNKINKMDIVGMFYHKGKLEKGDLGIIEVKDFVSFAAVKRNKANQLLQNLKNEKLKNKKVKIEIARDVVKKDF